MYWAVTVVGQKLRHHGVGPREAGGEGREVALLRGRRLLDATPGLLARGYRLGEEVSAASLSAAGVAVLAAAPFYDPESELRRLWREGWSAAAAELGEYLLRGTREPQQAFPGEPTLVAGGETVFWARLRLAAGERAEGRIPVTALAQVGIPARVVVELRRQGVGTLGGLLEALREGTLDLPLQELRRLRGVLLEGREGLPFHPWSPPPTAVREVLLGAAVAWPPLLAALRGAAGEVVAELRRAGTAVVKAELVLYAEAGTGGGEAWRTARRFSPPAGEERLVAALSSVLLRQRFGVPLERLVLEVEGGGPAGRPVGLFPGMVPPTRKVPAGCTAPLGPERREVRLSLYDPWRGTR